MKQRLLQKQCTVIKYWIGNINNVSECVLATTKYDEVEKIINKLKLNIISKEIKVLYYYATIRV